MQINRNLIVLALFSLFVSIVLAAESTSSSTGSSNSGSSSSSGSSASSTGTSGSRQGVASALTGSGLFTTLTSLLPTGIGSVLPVVLLFGLGALMVPAFGLGMLLREGRRSDSYNVQPNLAYATQALRNNPLLANNMQAAQANSNAQPAQAESQNFHYYRSFPSFNLDPTMVLDVMEKVMKALDNAEKKFN